MVDIHNADYGCFQVLNPNPKSTYLNSFSNFFHNNQVHSYGNECFNGQKFKIEKKCKNTSKNFLDKHRDDVTYLLLDFITKL